jgi:hypothetical protein
VFKLVFFSIALCFCQPAWSQAEIDHLICFPTYSRELKESGAKTIKMFHRGSNRVALKEIVSLDEQYKPKKIVYAEDLFMKDTTDIIYVDYTHFNKGIIHRVDSVFRASANLRKKIFDKKGNIVKIRNTDSKGGMVVKKIYVLDSFNIKVTTIYPYDKDTFYNQDALIPLHCPEVIIDDFGKPHINYDLKLKWCIFDSTGNHLLTKGLDGEVLQEIEFRNGLVELIRNYGGVPSVEHFEYDISKRVTSVEKRDASDYLIEHRQYNYGESKNRVSCIEITTPNSINELCYQYPTDRTDKVVKIVENYSIDSKRGRVLNNIKHFTKNGFLIWYGQFISTSSGKRVLLSDEYRLER